MNEQYGKILSMKYIKKELRHFKKHWIRNTVLLILSLCALFTGIFALWFASIDIPDLQAFQSRVVSQSTKIYDRTGQILLYDIHANEKRTVVTWDDISEHIKDATISIEDADFYNHPGIKVTSIIRAIFANITSAGYAQGGSTITQQVVKNTILTNDKTITRKLKEWVLALKLERVLTKQQILTTYLNESPYGGNIYGVQEASMQYFGKSAKDVTIAESAYLAALPQAPTYYSPFGKNKASLDARQKTVLKKMLDYKYITQVEYDGAIKEKVNFLLKTEGSMKAPHFSMFIRDYLVEKYGEEKVMNGGLRVTTTMDYTMQQKAELTVSSFAQALEDNFDASNTAMTAINPKNGDILVMVGSKNYFDTKIDGNVNIVTSMRQPGSSFKPFVYAEAWEKGYTPETVLFDAETEFSSECTPDGKTKNPSEDPAKICYSPVNYDGIYEGPLTMKKALAQSRNIPAVKTLYLAGERESLNLAKTMGITTLGDPNRYGLTLVLGGGEVTLLDMTSAYGVFANEGNRVPYRYILKVEDSDGNILEQAEDPTPQQVVSINVAREISNALSDKSVRLDSINQVMKDVKQDVAVKTGTTNDYRDVWILGYTTDLVVGAWAGKNDNTPMEKKVAGVIITPVWAAFMNDVLKSYPVTTFTPPQDPPTGLAPVLRSIWQGNVAYTIDKISGKVATEYTPEQTREERVFNGVHTILKWIDKDNPLGPIPTNPEKDSQYANWEYGVRKWFDQWKKTNTTFVEASATAIPTETDNVHIPANMPTAKIILPAGANSTFSRNQSVSIEVSATGKYPINKAELFINNSYIGASTGPSFKFTFSPADYESTKENNDLTAIVYDSVYNSVKVTIPFNIKSD